MVAPDAWSQYLPYASSEIMLDGHAYRFIDEGVGAPLLMSHGNPTWSFYWRSIIDSFRDTHRTVAVDHMGCGRSEKPQQYPYTLSQHIENLVTLIDTLDLHNITLIAHDWGGAIGLGAARQRPERFGRFALLNTGAFPPPFVPLRIRMCRFPWLGSWGMRRLNLFARAAIRMAVERPGSLSEDAKYGLLAPYDSWEHRVAIDGFVRDIPLTRKHPTWRVLSEIEAALPKLLSKPTALIWGMRDWCFRPECLRRFQASSPNAVTTELADVGHYVMEESPERVIAALQSFIDSTPVEQASAERDG